MFLRMKDEDDHLTAGPNTGGYGDPPSPSLLQLAVPSFRFPPLPSSSSSSALRLSSPSSSSPPKFPRLGPLAPLSLSSKGSSSSTHLPVILDSRSRPGHAQNQLEKARSRTNTPSFPVRFMPPAPSLLDSLNLAVRFNDSTLIFPTGYSNSDDDDDGGRGSSSDSDDDAYINIVDILSERERRRRRKRKRPSAPARSSSSPESDL